MAFGFAPAVPLDQVQMPPVTWTPDQAPQPAQAAPQAAPPPPQAAPQATPQSMPQPDQTGLPDIPVSPMETFMSMLTGGGTPGEAAQRVRAVKLQNLMDRYAMATAQDRYAQMQKLGGRDRFLYETDPAAFAKSDAKNLEPQNAAAGNTVFMRGGPNNPGGSALFAPKTDISTSGVPSVFTSPTSFQVFPTQLPGQAKAEGGIVYDQNRGTFLGRYATPQVVSDVASLKPFTPGFTPGAGGSAGPMSGNPGVPGMGGAGGSPATGKGPIGPQAAALLDTSGHLDPHAFFRNFWLPQEGGYNPSDGNGAPTNMGINQTANPGVNVATLNPQQAEQLFTSKYFTASGAANLPPALAVVHADTFGINPTMAQTFLRESGGDPNAYLGLRQAWMDGLEKTHPQQYAKYAQPWANRNAALQGLVDQFGAGNGGELAQMGADGNAVPSQIGPGVHGPSPYKPLTDPAERAANGINPNDHGSYVLTPTGPKLVAPDPLGPTHLFNLRKQVLDDPEYRDYVQGDTAYQAMLHAAAVAPGGMRAYALRDTFARTINPKGAVRMGTIEAIKQTQGIPDDVKGYLLNLKGDGPVDARIAQQILDVAHGFVQSNYAAAKRLNDSNVAYAQRYHLNPADVTAPMDDVPPPASLGPVPPPNARQPNTVYFTPKGPAVWLGNGQWRKLD